TGVVLGVTPRGEISAEAHGDRSGGDFSQTRHDNQARSVDRSRKSGSQREGNGQAIRHSNHHVADRIGRLKMMLGVFEVGHEINFRRSRSFSVQHACSSTIVLSVSRRKVSEEAWYVTVTRRPSACWYR